MSSVFYLTKREEIELFNSDPSLSKFFAVALSMIGRCRYVFGSILSGNLHRGSGKMKNIGITEEWKEAYTIYYESGKKIIVNEGLNCSLYVVWIFYNTFGKFTGPIYFTYKQWMLNIFHNMGFGTYLEYKQGTKIEAGTIVYFSEIDHIFIVLQHFEDGSLVILHSFDKVEQAIGATYAYNERHGKAYLTVKTLMQKHFPEHLERIKNNIGFEHSLNEPGIKCLKLSPSMMPDPDDLRSMDAENIINFLSEHKIMPFKEQFRANSSPEKPIREQEKIKTNPFCFEQGNEEKIEDRYISVKKFNQIKF